VKQHTLGNRRQESARLLNVCRILVFDDLCKGFRGHVFGISAAGQAALQARQQPGLMLGIEFLDDRRRRE